MSRSSAPASPGEEQPPLFSPASFPEIYERVLVGPLFQPWVTPLLDDVALQPGDRVLDVACGTGIVARGAKERLGAAGTVVGVDLNPQMLAVASSAAPTIDWRQGDAAALPLRDGERFDVVVCQQGFQFFPAPAEAARQMRAALTDQGRLGISTWCPDDEFPLLRKLRGIAEQHLGPIADRRHSLGQPGPVEDLLREAGFHDIRSKRQARTIRFPDGSAFVRLNAMALVSMSAGAGGLNEPDRQRLAAAIAAESAELVRLHTTETGFAYEIGTNVVLARIAP